MDKNQKHKKKIEKDLYGIEPKISLQSISFAPSENSYLNERTQVKLDECD